MPGTTFNPEQPMSTQVSPFFSTSIGVGNNAASAKVNGFRQLQVNAVSLGADIVDFTPASDDEVRVTIALSITAGGSATPNIIMNMHWTDPEGVLQQNLAIPFQQMGTTSLNTNVPTTATGLFTFVGMFIVGAQKKIQVDMNWAGGAAVLYDISITMELM